MRGLVFGLLALLATVSACGGNSSSPSPFSNSGGAGGSAGTAGSAGLAGSAGASSGGSAGSKGLGGPCVDDAQCDDHIPCTDDACDRELGRCRFSAVDERCADGVFCNGVEECQPGVGCRAGPPVQCSDMVSCTIDRCIEETHACEHVARDADGDGDPVWNCGGADCDDDDPAINGSQPEICGNSRDDNCNGMQDELPCVAPVHDSCADALLVDADGTYPLSLLAAQEDAALSCAQPGETRRDVVVALTVPPGPAMNVDVTAFSDDAGLALSAATSCSKQNTEFACAAAVTLPGGDDGQVARLVLRELSPGAYPLYVSGLANSDVALRVAYRESEPAPENETCGTALELPSEGSVVAALAGASLDAVSACQRTGSDLFYRFRLDEPHDVVLRALSLDGNGTPSLSLRNEDCVALASELDCRAGQPARLFVRSLPAGTYFVRVAAPGPSDVELQLSLRSPSAPAVDQGCATPPPIPAGVSQSIDLGDHENSLASACLPGAVDATRTLTLEQRSDVLLVERLSAGDTGAVSLLRPGCGESLSCTASDTSPVRTRAFGLPAGDYAVVAESRVGSPVELAAYTRPATPATLVAFADSCEDAVKVPETGGRYSGNTSNAHADFDAGCDYGGVSAGGGPEQMLKLSLSAPRRVILDMSGSDYQTLLVVRRADACPGSEVPHACAPGRGAGRSFLDLVLEAGDYYLQIDGFADGSGHWLLDVFLASP